MLNKKTRIDMHDTGIDVVVKLADGNPGAVSAVMAMTLKTLSVDPDSAFGPFAPSIALDAHGIYGPRIWMLFKDVCNGDVVKCLALLRAVQLGILSDDKLDHAIDHGGEGINVDDILKEVKLRLPRFDANEAPQGGCACGHSHGAPHNCPGCHAHECASATEGSLNHQITEVETH